MDTETMEKLAKLEASLQKTAKGGGPEATLAQAALYLGLVIAVGASASED